MWTFVFIYLGAESLGHVVTLRLPFGGTGRQFTTVAAPFCISSLQRVRVPMTHVLASNTCYYLTFFFLLFDYSHPSGYEVVKWICSLAWVWLFLMASTSIWTIRFS